MKIFLGQNNYIIGDLQGNTDKIIHDIHLAKEQKADIAVFSELAICGYPPDDFLLFHDFIEAMQKQLERIIKETKDIFVVVGLARFNKEQRGKPLYNSVAVICDQKLLGYKDKSLLPTYNVFDESRYFAEGEEEKVWQYKNKKIGVLICEDVWEHGQSPCAQYSRDPVEDMHKLQPDIVLLATASPYYYKKMDLRLEIYKACCQTLQCPMAIVNQVGGNDQLIFDGYSCCLNAKGQVVTIAKGFEEDHLFFDTDQKEPVKVSLDHIEDLYKALVMGVKDYFTKLKLTKACLGVSGGIDSALTAAIAVDALGKDNVLTLSMPSRFSSLSSIEDANQLVQNLNISIQHIPIDHVFQQFLDLLSPVFLGKPFGTAEENLQARIRGMVLMAVSNKLGHVVLSTGNKSEMAMGYTTLYGDMAGGLGVLTDVSKTLVYKLAKYVNRQKEIIPASCISKPPSAELKADQKDTDDLPSYDIVDAFLSDYVVSHMSLDEISKKQNLSKDLVQDLAKRLHRAEYKRRQGPLGLHVSKKSFSKGRFFPVVQKWIDN